jgi:hypothetical protein
MATNTNNLSRRETLVGIALCGATAATPIAGATIAIATQQPDRKAWDRAMVNYERAVAASDAYDAEYEHIAAAHLSAVEAVPHVTMPSVARGRTVTTADRHDVLMARSSCRSLRYVEACAYDDLKADQAFVDAADKRDAVIAGIDRRFDWDAVNERYDALSSAIGDTETVLLAMPAPDGEALLWKVNRLYTPGEAGWAEGVEDQTHADLHRLLSTGGA